MSQLHPNLLAGRKILLVEDEYFIAQDMARAFQDNGAEIVGPVATVDDALDFIDDTNNLDGAVLDVNLQGEMAYPVAEALLERGVPFVFATGYDASAIPAKFQAVTRCEKPVEPDRVGRALFK